MLYHHHLGAPGLPTGKPPRTAKLPTAAPLPLLVKPDEQQLMRQGQEGGLGARRGRVPLRTPLPAPPRLGLGAQGGLCPAVIYWDEGRGHATPGRMRPQGMGGGRGALHGSIPAV